jgi:glutamyl-tRNA synthetase
MKELEKEIIKYALLNAVQHDGKADVQSVLGKILGEKPEFRNKIKELISDIKKIVTDVNSWSKEKQEIEMKKLGVTIEKKVEEKKELADLPNAVMGKVITAFPPEPSKYPHIGHAKAALVNYLYAKKYKGKFILRFEDTNPELAKEEYYDAIIAGLKWLQIKWDKLDYTSNHVDEFYKVTEKLIRENKAYVCVCEQDKIKKNRRFMIECKCRNNPIQKNLELWKKMLTTFKEGEASVRIKISMDNKNAAMRDPSIMRIIDQPHVRTGKKYRVWPMYDFATSLMDCWEGVTHRVRSKEFEMRRELQQFIQKTVGLKITYITEMARFNLEGVPSSGRQIREMIQNKELMGWDDPRLTTLIALRRRGFDPEGIKEFLISTGVTKTESMLTWDALESFNRSIIDPKCNRYFAVFEPVEIKIENAPETKKVSVHLHPDFPKRGFREIPVNLNKIFISKNDFDKLREKEVRLIGLFNVKLDKIAKFTSKKVEMKMPKIQWVSEENAQIKVIMPDGDMKEGIAEPEIKKLKVDDRIQLVRIGFTRIDQMKPELVMYFTHK